MRYRSGILLLAPLIVFLLCFYVIPLTNLLAQSFSFSSGDTNRHDGWTFYQYLKTYDSARLGRVLIRTFRISFMTVLITLALSYPLALLLLRANRRLRTALLILTFVCNNNRIWLKLERLLNKKLGILASRQDL